MKKFLVLIFTMLLCAMLSVAQNVIPTACTTATYTVSNGDIFYDDGGAGGCPCTDGCPFNYANAACTTTVTLCPAVIGNKVSVQFREFAMFNTTSAWDWMKIYDNNTTSGTILFNNDIGGPHLDYGTCGDDPMFIVCATNPTGCLTFEFYATSVVSRSGWDGLVTTCSSLNLDMSANRIYHITEYEFSVGNIYQNGDLFLNVISENEKPINIMLCDAVGSKVISQEFNPSIGENQFNLGINNISSGIYLIRVQNENKIFTNKIFIK